MRKPEPAPNKATSDPQSSTDIGKVPVVTPVDFALSADADVQSATTALDADAPNKGETVPPGQQAEPPTPSQKPPKKP